MTYDYARSRRAARPIPVDKPALAALAKQLVRELPKHLKFRPSEMDRPLNHQRGFSANWGFALGLYETTDVLGFPVTVPVKVNWATMVDWSPTRQWIAGGGVTSRHFGPRGRGSKIGMFLKINAARSPNDILAHLDRVEKEAFSVLIHEVTHLRDLLQGLAEYHDDDGSPDTYYNSPREVRAFMQQIADEALAYVESQAKLVGVGLWGIQLSSRLIEQALATSLTWDRIRRFLTSRSERLVLRGVERALRDEWPRLAREYPDDPIDDQ